MKSKVRVAVSSEPMIKQSMELDKSILKRERTLSKIDSKTISKKYIKSVYLTGYSLEKTSHSAQSFTFWEGTTQNLFDNW